MADEPKKPGKKGWKTREQMRDVGGSHGKLHRELDIPEGEKIPQARLAKAEHSDNPEIKRDAIRAKTMEGWQHGKKRAASLYTHPRSQKLREAHG